MYYERVSPYVYQLPCGHDFRSLTRSMADDEDNMHHFYCLACELAHAVKTADLIESRPRSPRGALLGDGEVARRVDSAIKADRVVACYRNVWDDLTQAEVSALTGVSEATVWKVALSLGVYREERTAPAVRRLKGSERVTTADLTRQAA